MSRKRKRQFSLSAVAINSCILFAAWLLLQGRWLLLSAICLIVGLSLIAFKLYPRWSQRRRFRALELADVDNMSGHTFEQYVASLLRHQGFQATVTKGSNDLGVDVVAERDGVKYAIQCKRYSDDLSRHAVSDAVSGKHYYGCDYAMVVTNRYFRRGAIELANASGCTLIDRDDLASWVEAFQTGEAVSATWTPADETRGAISAWLQVRRWEVRFAALSIPIALGFVLFFTYRHFSVPPTSQPTPTETQAYKPMKIKSQAPLEEKALQESLRQEDKLKAQMRREGRGREWAEIEAIRRHCPEPGTRIRAVELREAYPDCPMLKGVTNPDLVINIP